MLFGHQHRRAREVDERALVLDEAAAGALALRRGAGGAERSQAVDPQLRHAIVRLGAAAPAPQPFVHGRRQRVDLHVAANAERLGGFTHERAMPLAPVALELLARERSEEHTSELQSLAYLVCRLLLEKKKQRTAI